MLNLSAGCATINSVPVSSKDTPVSASCIAAEERFGEEDAGCPAPAAKQSQFGKFDPEPVVSVPRADKALAKL